MTILDLIFMKEPFGDSLKEIYTLYCLIKTPSLIITPLRLFFFLQKHIFFLCNNLFDSYFRCLPIIVTALFVRSSAANIISGVHGSNESIASKLPYFIWHFKSQIIWLDIYFSSREWIMKVNLLWILPLSTKSFCSSLRLTFYRLCSYV